MPLNLNIPDPTTELKKRIYWDPNNPKDVLEAQSKINELKKFGFTKRTISP